MSARARVLRGIDVRNEVLVRVEGFPENEILAGLFLGGFAQYFKGWPRKRVCFPRHQFLNFVPMGEARLQLFRLSLAGKGEGEGSLDCFLIRIGFLRSADGEGECSGVDGLTVEEAENLRGDGGGIAALAGKIRRRGVERFHERVAESAEFQGVDGAAVALLG